MSIISQNKEIFRDRYKKAREENAWSYDTHSNVYGFQQTRNVDFLNVVVGVWPEQ